MAFLRIAAEIPAPLSLSDFEPLCAISGNQFAMRQFDKAVASDIKIAAKACRKEIKQGLTIGYCTVPRVRAIFFDMDATVIKEESLVEVAKACRLEQQVAEVTERAMAGEIDFQTSVEQRLKLLAGVDKELLVRVSLDLQLQPGIQPFVAACREMGIATFMVTGGFYTMALHIQRIVGFDEIYANTLDFDESAKLTGKLRGNLVDAKGKKNFVLEKCAAGGIAPSDIAVVGDGANDMEMMSIAGVAVGHQPKPILREVIHGQNMTGDHRFLGALLFGRDISITRSRLLY